MRSEALERRLDLAGGRPAYAGAFPLSVRSPLSALAPVALVGAVAAAVVAGAALGNALPLAPGGLGVPAAAMAIALGRSGVGTATAVAAAMTFHLLETSGSLVFGAAGCLLGRRAP